MAEPIEIELKLALLKGRPARARQLLARVSLERTSIDDVYFDTPECELRRRGLVLRIRRDGERWMQTLKAAPSQKSLVPVRGEWEVALPSGGKAPPLDLERFDIEPLRLLMRAGLDAGALAPLFRSRITRRRGIALHGVSKLEVALDDGELIAREGGGHRRQAVTEVEVELKAGRPEDVLDFAAELLRKGRGVTLVPAVRSKAERGYALARDVKLDAVRAAGRDFAQQVAPTMGAAEALRAVIRHGLAIVVANADALRESPAAEHVHQARVALRRMRSAIRLLDPNSIDLPAGLLHDLRWLARKLGHARDWDVIGDDTLPALLVAARLQPQAQRHLRRACARQREHALARAVAAVSSRRYARLVLLAARFSMSDRGGPAADAAIPVAALLEEAAGLLFADARRFARLDSHARHRVRIHAKRLRYALDLFAARLPERGTSDYVDALSSLQDSLGALNDAAVAVDRLIEFARTREERQALKEWLAGTERDLLGGASRELRSLARRVRPWTLRTTR